MAEILTLSNPNVVLDEVFIPDNETGIDEGIKTSELEGQIKPSIMINAYMIKNVTSFQLESTGFYPTVNFSFIDDNGDFSQLFFPKDGDIISVYIKSNNRKRYKSIRLDFNILEISSFKDTYTVNGIIRLNGLTTEYCKAYNMSSFDCLKAVSSELNLGYASNIAMSNDIMNWINPNDTHLKFMQDVISHSWIDETSFQTCFIDLYYYLNYVEVSRQFKDNTTLEKTALTFIDNIEMYHDENANFESELELILSNHPRLSGTSMHILNWNLFNNTHQINFNHGYIKDARWFDYNQRLFDNSIIDPITTENSESSKQIMKGRVGDMSYTNHIKYRYLGNNIVSNEKMGNVHENYALSEIHNLHNEINASKMGLTIELEGINAHLYRYQTIPIIIYDINPDRNENHIIRDKAVNEYSEDSPESENNMKNNKMISGFYVIKDIKYKWLQNDSNLKMELTLIRREWPFQFPKNMIGRNDG